MDGSMSLSKVIDLSIFPEKKGVFIVGGSIRDHLLGKLPVDFDIVVSKNFARFAEKMGKILSRRVITLGRDKMPVCRIVSNGTVFDISPLKGDDIEQDLKQRDFTVNAMAYSIQSGEIIDCTGGRKDLLNKSVRMVSDDAFKEDPVRLLRAFRIAAALNFEIDTHTMGIIEQDARLLKKSAAERIREELFAFFHTHRSCHYLEQMDKSGLLLEIFPDLIPLKGCPQNNYHAYDVFHHTLKAYFHMEALLNDMSSSASRLPGQLAPHIKDKSKALLKYAILLHDIGKPTTMSKDDRGNIHFYRHGLKSAEMSRSISRRLTLPNKDADYAQTVISHHNRPLHLFKLHRQDRLTPKAEARFFIHCGEHSPDILLHSIADYLGKGPANRGPFVDFACKTMESYFSSHKIKKEKPPLITGKDLIERFGLKPSPLFKTILEMVEESRLSDQIQTKTDALLMVKNYLYRHRSSNS